MYICMKACLVMGVVVMCLPGLMVSVDLSINMLN
jgi:hypothetical protein